MSEAKVAQTKPYVVDLNEGDTKFWCACGHSQNQPYCDGSHKESGTGLSPVKFVADKDGKFAFCGCKQSAGRPMCDGTHAKL